MADARAAGDTMRVLYVHTATQPPLGADTWIQAQIIRHIDRRSHDLHVACRTTAHGAPTPTYEAIRDIPDLRVVPVDFGPELVGRSRIRKLLGVVATLPAVLSIARLVALVRRRHIALIHTSDRPRDAFAAVVIGRLTGATSVVHVHVGYNPDWMGWMLRWSLAHADALIAVSDFVAGTLEEGRLGAERIHVVHNGIDVAAWEPGVGRQTVRRELAIADSTAVVVTVCRLFPEKGPGDLIRAIAALRDAIPDLVLLVVGQPLDPSYGTELVALTRQLAIDQHVRFLDRRPDVAAVMAAGDVFAMPSHEEPFGLVFVEAMAMRRPVVALADGGTIEVVDDGKSGLLSTWGDIAQLTANLRILLQDSDMRDSMGEYGRDQAEARFTVQRMANEVAHTYRLLSSPSH